jgi:hypothetical protein
MRVCSKSISRVACAAILLKAMLLCVLMDCCSLRASSAALARRLRFVEKVGQMFHCFKSSMRPWLFKSLAVLSS